MGRSLIAFDTEHIKRYVFGTNKLKEIRGASSLLDYLNRIVMFDVAKNNKYDAEEVYANGGSGLYTIDSRQADKFGKAVQRQYNELTGGRASVIYAIQPLPEERTEADEVEHLKLLHWRLLEEQQRSPEFIALPSHPFIRMCDACGTEYATKSERIIRDPGETDELYCESCQKKREQDKVVKDIIEDFITTGKKVTPTKEYLWQELLALLKEMGYDLSDKPERPKDFNIFSQFKGAKNYLGLVYADANSMGRAMEDLPIEERRKFANHIDKAIYKAVCTAINKHLQIKDHLKPKGQRTGEQADVSLFPFDILLLGGDDVLMVVPATVALDVALTIAEEFHSLTKELAQNGFIPKERTLSVGAVLAPVKYPFGLLREMAETTLKAAKKAGADAREREEDDDTRINFLIVTGSSRSDFKDVYEDTFHKKSGKRDALQQEFHATLRPYTTHNLRTLLNAIREGNRQRLGRSKLHELREAVLQMNTTTSVLEGLALLANWHEQQRTYVVQQVYEFGGRCQMPQSDPDKLVFPRVHFPWFYEGKNKEEQDVYRTSLLDFVELYDFISQGTESNGSEKN